jgi:hypothetical protein
MAKIIRNKVKTPIILEIYLKSKNDNIGIENIRKKNKDTHKGNR